MVMNFKCRNAVNLILYIGHNNISLTCLIYALFMVVTNKFIH